MRAAVGAAAPMGDAAEAAKPSTYRSALADLGRSTVPMILVQVSQQIVSSITVMRAGSEFGTAALAATALGLLTFNLFGLMLVMTPMQALDTVAPREWGAANHAEVGIACQRAFIFAMVITVPAAAAWSHAEVILVALGQVTPIPSDPPRINPTAETESLSSCQDAEVASLAAAILIRLVPVLPALAAFESARRLLYAQVPSQAVARPQGPQQQPVGTCPAHSLGEFSA